MFYAHYDDIGVILGFYTDDVHTIIPEPNIPITNEQWNDCINNQGKWKIDVDARMLVLAPLPPPPKKEELLEREILQIKLQYFDRKAKLKDEYLEAIMLDDVEGASKAKGEFKQIIQECNDKIHSILNQ